jgi:CRP-like cAMP-binding protein
VEAVQPGRADVERRLSLLLTPEEPAVTEPHPQPAPSAPVQEQSLPELDEEPPPAVPPIPLFTDLDARALAAVARRFRLVRAEPGDIVVAEGEPGGSLFIVTSGLVKAFVKSPRGRYAEVRELGEGEFFGEISVLDGSPRTATITAAARCELLELDQEALSALTEAHPRVRETLVRMRDERAHSSVETLVRGMRFGSS